MSNELEISRIYGITKPMLKDDYNVDLWFELICEVVNNWNLETDKLIGKVINGDLILEAIIEHINKFEEFVVDRDKGDWSRSEGFNLVEKVMINKLKRKARKIWGWNIFCMESFY
tara:strand:- start:75 stop:419 length:345 start_codon:yes stop_codon:yes gene_type:complete